MAKMFLLKEKRDCFMGMRVVIKPSSGQLVVVWHQKSIQREHKAVSRRLISTKKTAFKTRQTSLKLAQNQREHTES